MELLHVVAVVVVERVAAVLVVPGRTAFVEEQLRVGLLLAVVLELPFAVGRHVVVRLVVEPLRCIADGCRLGALADVRAVVGKPGAAGRTGTA